MVRSSLLSRRTILRGAGALMALPWLEAMGGRKASAVAGLAPEAGSTAAPVRMAFLYMPNGVNPDAWQPAGTGKAFELSRSLTPLADFKNDILVLSELMNAGSIGGDGHYVKTGGFLTGTTITKTTGKDLRSGGTSVDQIAAQGIGRKTLLPSLELGIDPAISGVDTNVGYTQLYGSHISWSTPSTPIAKEINPRLAFDRLFRPGKAGASPEDDRSVLDLVAEDAKSLRGKVGRADQMKLDNYLESVRDVEQRIEANTKRRAEESHVSPAALQEIEALDKKIQVWQDHPDREKLRGLRRGGDHSEHVRLMLDMIFLAFWSDATRVSTFMFGNAVSPRNFSFLDGVKGGHHEISHHKNDKAALEMYARINAWHVEQFGYLLGRMRSVKEGERTLLDNSMILFGAGMRDGNRHDPNNLPIVLAGKGGGTLQTGRHVAYAKRTPLCNLYRSMLDRMGTPTPHIGDSTGVLPGLDDPNFGGQV